MTTIDEALDEAKGHRFVVIGDNGKVTSRRFHLFEDCHMLPEGSAIDLNYRESQFLGLRKCMACTKRMEGGPALDLLEEFFTNTYPELSQAQSRVMGRRLIDHLKGYGAFVAVRRSKTNGSTE